MEADWEFEVGGDGPVIEGWWPGYFNLRSNPDLVTRIPEVAELPALAPVLVCLNAGGSPVWTSKCGIWNATDPDLFDPYELDAPAGGTAYAAGCYIDLLPKSEEQWPAPEPIAAECKRWCAGLRTIAQRSCRVDFVIRRAFFLPDRFGLGITAYLTGCGASAEDAQTVVRAALGPFADVLCG